MAKKDAYRTVAVCTLRALHDTAIRSYYTYNLVDKLIRVQRKTFIDLLGTNLTVIAAIISIFSFYQVPQARITILVVSATVIALILVGYCLATRKLRESEILEKRILLGIYLDEMAKYTTQLRAINKLGAPDDPMTLTFIDMARSALNSARRRVKKTITELQRDKVYEKSLKFLGIDKDWIDKRFQEAEKILS